MTDPLRSPETTGGAGPDPGADGRPRRWMFVLVAVLAIALLGLIVFLHVSGAIGPGLH